MLFLFLETIGLFFYYWTFTPCPYYVYVLLKSAFFGPLLISASRLFLHRLRPSVHRRFVSRRIANGLAAPARPAQPEARPQPRRGGERRRRREEAGAAARGDGPGRRERGGAHPAVHGAGGGVGDVRTPRQAHPVDAPHHPRLRPLHRPGRRPLMPPSILITQFLAPPSVTA